MEIMLVILWLGFILFIGTREDGAMEIFIASIWVALPLSGVFFLGRLVFR